MARFEYAILRLLSTSSWKTRSAPRARSSASYIGCGKTRRPGNALAAKDLGT
jgi:hypothetical protein